VSWRSSMQDPRWWHGALDASFLWALYAWMSEELPFLTVDRRWERAIVIVSGTPRLDHDPVN
jgi:hypothetical protein